MRTLTTLSALILGLTFVFWAPAAKADCPHKGTKFNHPHCGGDEPPPRSPNFVLMDCADLNCGRDPQQVGTVIDIELGRVLVFLTIQDSLAQPRNIVLSVGRAKIANQNPAVWFDNINCSGFAWIQLDPGDAGIASGSDGAFFPPAIEDYAITSDTSDQTVRSLWVATNDIVFSGTSVSRAHSQGCTSPFAQAFSGVPAEKIADDLHADFPFPYTLEIQ